MEAHTRIEMFGGLRVKQGDHERTNFGTRHCAGLLAYLAYQPEREHAREVLCGIFWPDSDKARGSLNTALGSLRKQLEPPDTIRGPVLTSDKTTVRISPGAISTDVAEFQQNIRSAGRPASEQRKRHLLEDAEALYKGPLLPGVEYEWKDAAERYLAQQYYDAVKTLLDILTRAGELGRAVEVANRAVSHDTQREESHQDLMRALHRNGQPEEALRQYRQLETILKKELELEPSEESQALARQIREALKAARQPAPSSGPALAPSEPSVDRRRTAVRPPSGTVTFLVVDIDGRGQAGEEAAEQLRGLLRPVARQGGGHVMPRTDAAVLAAFAGAGAALTCTLALRRELENHAQKPVLSAAWMALDTGDAAYAAERYEGAVVERAGRLLTAANPGQILCSDTFAALARANSPEAARFLDLGAYRLGGADSRLRIWQVDDPGGHPRTFPPLNAQSAYGGSLPHFAGRFFGRKAELANLRTRFVDHAERLVTLTGIGGSGKTRLAREAALLLVEHFQEAVWFISLEDVAYSWLIIDTIRKDIHLTHRPDIAPMDQVAEALSQQPSLLVLDNFEHLVEGGAEVIQSLLDAVPTLQCLVTSRRVLNISSEREFPVPPLPKPNGTDTPERLYPCESVQLFIDRAQAGRPDFQVTNSNAADLAAILDLLDGIPLSIVLVAAKTQLMSIKDLLAHVQTKFLDLEMSKKRGVPSRHRSMRAAIDLSYKLLAPELQRFFTCLSVFSGGWTAAAAEAVLEEPYALDYLGELRDSSLVETDAAHEEMRFTMQPTLREYATQQLAEEDPEAVALAHAEYYLALAERAVPEYERADQVSWLKRMALEHANLRAATDFAIETGQRELQARLVLAHFPLQYKDGYWDAARRGLAAAQEIIPEIAGDRGASFRAAIQYCLAYLAEDYGEFEYASGLLVESLAARRRLGDKVGIADCLNLSGTIATSMGRFEEARRFLEEIPAHVEMDDYLRLGRMHHNLGNLGGYLKDPARNRQLTETALELYRLAGDLNGQSIILLNLGKIALDAGEMEVAEWHFRRSIVHIRTLGKVAMLPLAVNNLGYWALRKGDYAMAATLCYHAGQIAERLKSQYARRAQSSLGELEKIVGPEQYAELLAEAERTSWESAAGLEE